MLRPYAKARPDRSLDRRWRSVCRSAPLEVSLPVAWRLYLREVWTQDKKRQTATGIPPAIRFQSKPEIALQQIRTALEREIPAAPILADAAYGSDTKFREGITELGLIYMMGSQSSVSVWSPSQAPMPKRSGKESGVRLSCYAAATSMFRWPCARWR